MVDINRMTHKLQEALQQAGGVASRRNHQGIDVEHLLLALLDQEGGLASNLIEVAGVAPRAMRDAVERELNRKPQVKQAAGGPSQAYLTQRLAGVLDKAEGEMRNLKDDYLSVEHVLLAIVDEHGPVVRELGLQREKLMEALKKVRGNQRVTSPDPEATYEALGCCCAPSMRGFCASAASDCARSACASGTSSRGRSWSSSARSKCSG